jgi:Baseplate J-like protein
MSEQYIEIPIETDPELLAQESFDALGAAIPGWVPNDANLETLLIEALSRMTSEARDVASAVPTDIFRYYGELVGIVPQEATFATALSTWTMISSAGYTIPAGTQVGIVLTGDVIVPFEVTDDIVIPPGFTQNTSVNIRAVEAGSDASGITGAVTLLDTLDFVQTITLNAPTADGIDAEEDDAYLNRLRLQLSLMTPRPILARDFAILAQNIEGIDRAVAIDGYDPDHNLLSANQSSLETATTGWEVDANATITRDTTQASDGIASLRVASVAAGNASARTLSGTSGEPVTSGQQYTAVTYARPTAVRTIRIIINWYTAAGAANGSNQADFTSQAANVWSTTPLSVTAVAPANSAFAAVVVMTLATAAANEFTYFDRIAFRKGPSTVWKIGDSPEFGVERYITVVGVDENGLALTTAKKNELDAYLESLREVNFVVNVIDPVYTTVDVTFAAVAQEGWTPSDVETRAEQAVTDYLSPKNWGLPEDIGGDVPVPPEWVNTTTVRYLELASVINGVGGLDYITSLTLRKGTEAFAAADVVLAGVVPLPQPGTITGTVSAPA